MNKLELIENAIRELKNALEEQLAPRTKNNDDIGLPPTLPVGEGRYLHANQNLINIVSQYSLIWLNNFPDLKARFKNEEFGELARLAFGQTLANIDLDCQTPDLVSNAKNEIDTRLRNEINRSSQNLEIILGCNLFGSSDVYPIEIGPVSFYKKDQWRCIALQNGTISDISARRLERLWRGERLKKRMRSNDATKEETIIDAIGSDPIVCTVRCNGLSSKMTEEKSLLVARLAMCVLSLMWKLPSQMLQQMNLIYDGEFYQKVYLLHGDDGHYVSSRSKSKISIGSWVDEDLAELIEEYENIFDIFGKALKNYVQPRHDVNRPNIMNALFQSLWWFHEACREPSDQISTTKYAASMDALAAKGKKKGIIRLIEARIGPRKNDRLMSDGRTTDQVISKIYDDNRSRFIHGTSPDYMDDWTKSRLTSEAIARLCLVQTCDWLLANPEIDEVELISRVEV